MNPKMNEASALYLKEMMVLEDARDTLLTTLSSLWLAIDEASKSQLDAHATAAGGKLARWDNKSNPAHHERWIEKKASIVFKLLIDDPRLTRTGYRLTINCTNEERAKLNRIPGARDKFEALASASGIQHIRWTRSDAWNTSIMIDVNDLNQTASDIASRMSEIFKTISEFTMWYSRHTSQAAD